MKFRYRVTTLDILTGAEVRHPLEIEADTQEDADAQARCIARIVEQEMGRRMVDRLINGTGDPTREPKGVLHVKEGR